ncbi:hypothetical protein A3A38_00735 [Candidatus Kaiserbacteria bacterium RIFCSPLOWO2_01_FULL_53_17]|uniref:HTH arsR-type domain-containing protein n=1 Tax=Candidatus Kaiserbacteria bacterium RIFCSPLOWO2_01_FULL_53_17 TaxID=1798511 RepID=A0A1F6EGC7_9BACT|nr:MAG: hypothetical protein A3A38_00735 [Candidatus Kaiserbacteria bacterium RIFCSPLOWO2_01_FULL_53_17]
MIQRGLDTSVTIRETEKIFKALANRRRLAVVRYLQKESVATVGDIAHEIPLSFKATSKHLGILFAANIVEREQVSLNMNYRLVQPLHSVTKTALSLI